MLTRRIILAGLVSAASAGGAAAGGRQPAERLGRGVVAVPDGGGGVFVSWRLLSSDGPGVAFNVYRREAAGEPVRVNDRPVAGATWLRDRTARLDRDNAWTVRAVHGGREGPPGRAFVRRASAPSGPWLTVPLRTPPGCVPNDAAVGDLDGDGEYEIVLKQQMRPRDNARPGRTGQTKLEAYRLDGTLLWRIDLGRNIREGPHYTPFIVYDLDGDGRAELACRTADGTTDGTGAVLGDPAADHRNAAGYVLSGPEFLTVFDGRSGRVRASVPYVPPRGDVGAWGDRYGNRADRFLAAVAYLDGRRPSLVMCRGYYTRTVLAAWNWRGGRLEHVWTFDSDAGPADNRRYRGQGNHNLAVGDIDGDGRDEIVYGACAIDDDGTGLYSTGLGHGDAMHLADIDPARPGLEVFGIHERPRHRFAANLRDARTGRVLWGLPAADVGRGLAMDIDPRHEGAECWAAGGGLSGLYDCRGRKICDARPRSCNMGAWWDGDLLRELVDGVTIEKWDYRRERTVRLLTAGGCAANNGTKANPSLVADILGDWREEVLWRSADNRELRIYVSTAPTPHRIVTLMEDNLYRLGIAVQNVGYNQPAHVSALAAE